MDKLGFGNNQLPLLESLLQLESGLVLVTGATGSGKTTTLYSCLNWLQANTQKNIVTIEDPVEAIIPNVRQSQINRDANYTFKTGLRSILRQDPDIILVGEIRDEETLRIALEAAYTGHLVLASLHTNDVRATLQRLLGFYCETQLLAHVLKGIISQRLIAKPCLSCHDKSTSGCLDCNYTGTAGRQLITDFLAIKKSFFHQDMDTFIDTLISKNIYYSFEDDLNEKGVLLND